MTASGSGSKSCWRCPATRTMVAPPALKVAWVSGVIGLAQYHLVAFTEQTQRNGKQGILRTETTHCIDPARPAAHSVSDALGPTPHVIPAPLRRVCSGAVRPLSCVAPRPQWWQACAGSISWPTLKMITFSPASCRVVALAWTAHASAPSPEMRLAKSENRVMVCLCLFRFAKAP